MSIPNCLNSQVDSIFKRTIGMHISGNCLSNNFGVKKEEKGYFDVFQLIFKTINNFLKFLSL